MKAGRQAGGLMAGETIILTNLKSSCASANEVLSGSSALIILFVPSLSNGLEWLRERKEGIGTKLSLLLYILLMEDDTNFMLMVL